MTTARGVPIIVNLADVEAESVEWLWFQRIPRGKLTLLDGDPGTSKTTLALDIAARVTRGDTMPDGTCSDLTGPRGVVILTAEDGLADTVRPRLDAAGADTSLVVALQGVGSDEEGSYARLPEVRDVEAIAEAIEKTDAAFVILDPLVAYLGEGTDAHRDAKVRRALAPLVSLAEATGVAVLGIRHLNKKADVEKALYRGGGSIAFSGSARSVLIAAVDPDDPSEERRVLASIKANLAKKGPSFAFRTVEADNGAVRIEWLGESTLTADQLLGGGQPYSASKRDQAGQWLRRELQGGPVPTTNILERAGAAGHAEKTLRRAADAMDVQKTRVGFGGPWTWTLPTADNPAASKDQGVNEEGALATFGEATSESPTNTTLLAKVPTLDPVGHLLAPAKMATNGGSGHLRPNQANGRLLGGAMGEDGHGSSTLGEASAAEAWSVQENSREDSSKTCGGNHGSR